MSPRLPSAPATASFPLRAPGSAPRDTAGTDETNADSSTAVVMAFLTAAEGAPKGVDYWAAANRNAPFWRADLGAAAPAAFAAFFAARRDPVRGRFTDAMPG